MRSAGKWAVVAVVLLSTMALAQTYQGRLSGTVTDQSGAVVRGAKVVVTNTDTGAARDLVTNDAGDWVAPNLAPGPYKITISAPNFKRIERSGVRLEVAKDVHIDTALQPGTIGEVVNVTGEAPLVETMNDTLGGTFTNKAINDLPLNGRDFQNLVVLRPGVQRGTGGGFLSISSNGLRPEDNNFIVDGTDNNDPYYATTVINAEGVQGTPGSHLPIDAIQEFNAQENPPAEYGWKPGAIVNVGLKSGTNTFHGTAYDFERNSAFDARNYFNPTTDPNTGLPEAQRALRLHEFGFSAGGPIVRNKVFIFGAYEGVRALVSNSESLSSPQTTAGGGPGISIPDAVANVTALCGPGCISPLSTALTSLYPANTDPGGILNVGFPNNNREDDFIIKGDYKVNDHNSLTARYFFGDSLQTERDVPVLQPFWLSTSQLRAQVFGVNWTFVPNPRWVNEAKFGFNRFWQIITVADASHPSTDYGINTGVTTPVNFGMPEIAVDGFTSLGGNHSWPLETVPNQTFQFTDNVSWTHGRHTLRFGGEVRHGSTHNLRDRYGKSRIRFEGGELSAACGCYPAGVDSSPLEDFVAGFPAAGRIFVGDSDRFVSMNSFGAFVQDDFRMSSRFTINIGVRYDLTTVIRERNNLLANFDPAQGLLQVGNQIGSPYDGDHNNFAPRIGVAWDPWGRGKTVIRAGAGITYEIPHLAVFLGQNGVNNASTAGINVIPTGATGVTPGGGTINAGSNNIFGTVGNGGQINYPNFLGGNIAGPVFPSANALDCSQTTGAPCDILAVDPHLRTPYVINWNLNVQQAFGPNTSLQLGYVGTHGVKLYSIYDINQVDPNAPAENGPFAVNGAGTVISCDHCEQAGRPFNLQFPFLEFVNWLSNGYTSSYNGLQATLTQRAWKGMSFVAGYTWAHAIDDVSLNRAQQPQNSLLPGLERASGDNDIRHRFTLAYTWEIPGRPGFAQMAKGWEVTSIVTLQSGTPYTGYDFENDISLTGEYSDRWNFFGNPADFQTSPTTAIPFSSDCSTYAGAPAGSAGFPCYHMGNSFIVQPPFGTFGNMGRNLFRASGYRNWDFSVTKKFSFGERLSLQLRGEFFNILNHPNFANPVILFNNDLGIPSTFGLASATPDVAAANPVIGTGGNRAIQLGAKFIW